MAWGNDNGKGHNPWGSVPPSGGGGGRPPEYDDLFGNFLNRMRGMMPGFLRGRGVITILLVLVLVFLASTTVFRVQPAERLDDPLNGRGDGIILVHNHNTHASSLKHRAAGPRSLK